MDDILCDFVETVCAQAESKGVWRHFAGVMRGFGLNGLLYAYQRGFAGGQLQLRGRSYLFAQHDPQFLDDLLASGQMMRSRALLWARENCGTLSWRELAAWAALHMPQASDAGTREIWLRHGFRAGYVVSFRDPAGRIDGIMSLSARGFDQQAVDAIWAEHGRLISVIGQVTHLRLSAMPGPTDQPDQRDPALSSRQREVLEWIAVGKTTADVAEIMGLRPATVEKHLRLARQTLGAETTPQAVMTATLRDEIFNLSGERAAPLADDDALL